MSSTALTIPAQGLPQSFEDFARCLRNSTDPFPAALTQEAGPAAQFALAWLHLTFAARLAWHALAAIPAAADRAACRQLARIPRTTLLAASASGCIAWGWALFVTILFIWR